MTALSRAEGSTLCQQLLHLFAELSLLTQGPEARVGGSRAEAGRPRRSALQAASRRAQHSGPTRAAGPRRAARARWAARARRRGAAGPPDGGAADGVAHPAAAGLSTATARPRAAGPWTGRRWSRPRDGSRGVSVRSWVRDGAAGGRRARRGQRAWHVAGWAAAGAAWLTPPGKP